MLRGTWCTLELLKAVEKSYTIVKIHEIWHFPPKQRRTGLFADYVNTWLKVKQESSGWPSWYKSLPGTGGHPSGYCQHLPKIPDARPRPN